MTSRDRVMASLRREEPDRVPFVELLVDEAVAIEALGIKPDPLRQKPPVLEPGSPIVGPLGGGAGVYRYCDLARRLSLDAFGFGIQAPFWAKLTANEKGREFLTGGLVHAREDLKHLQFPDPEDDALYEPARLFLRENRGEHAVFAFVNLGLDPVVLSMGLESFSYALNDDPGLIAEFLELCTDWIAATIPRICALGFDFLWAGDDLAFNSGPFFSPSHFRTLMLPSLRKVTERISLPWAFHSDGNILPIMEDLLSLGMSALHPIDPKAMDIVAIKRDYGRRICLMGNIDLAYTLTRGTPQETETEVRRRILEAGPRGGYIVSSANSVTSYVKLDNLLAVGKAIHKYGWYPLEKSSPQ